MGKAKQVDLLLGGVRHPTTDEVLDGGKVKSFVAGTSTLSALFTDNSKSAVLSNPVVLNSAGIAEAYGDGYYKFEIYDKNDNLLDTIDGIYYGSSIPGEEFQSLAFMRAATGDFAARQLCYLHSFSADLGGGGGVFIWDHVSTEADDGVNIIKCTAIATGRWKRVQTDFISFDTVTALRAGAGPYIAGQKGVLMGYYAVGGSGGGDLYWDSTSTDTDDGVTIFKCATITTGRWKRLYDGPVNALWAGCYNDGTNSAINDVAIARVFAVGLNWYFPSGTYVFSADQTLPNTKNWNWTGDGYFRTIFSYTGSGVAFKMADQASVRRVRAKGFSIRNAGTGTEGLYLASIQESFFDEVEAKDFSSAQMVISAGVSNGCFWIKLDKCRLYTSDLATSVGLLCTREATSTKFVNAVTMVANRIGGYVTNPSIGVRHDHSGDSLTWTGNWFENLDWAMELACFNSSIVNNRFENINADSGKTIKIREDWDALAGSKTSMSGNKSDSGRVSLVDSTGTAFIPPKSSRPPFSDGVSELLTYTRTNGDGKDGWVEKAAGGDLELSFDYDQATKSGFGADERIRYYVNIDKVVVTGAGATERIRISGLESDGTTTAALGKLDDGTFLYSMDGWISEGTQSVVISTPWLLGANVGSALALVKIKAADVAAGVTVTITSAVGSIGWETMPTGDMIER